MSPNIHKVQSGSIQTGDKQAGSDCPGQSIAAPKEFKANSALGPEQIAELTRFVTSNPAFEISYEVTHPEYRFKYSKNVSGSVVDNSLKITKENGAEVIIIFDQLKSLRLSKL